MAVKEAIQQISSGITFSVTLIDAETGAWLDADSNDTCSMIFKRPTETGVQTVTGAISDPVGTEPTGTPPIASFTVPTASTLLSLLGEYAWQAHITAGGFEYYSPVRKFQVFPNLA